MTDLYPGALTVLLLADKDITSLIAFVLFAVISVLGNALKKRAEAKRQEARSSPDEEHDEMPELLSAGPTFDHSVPSTPPRPVPPLPGEPRPARQVRRLDQPTTMPNDVYDLAVAQIARKASQPFAPKTSSSARTHLDLATSEAPRGNSSEQPFSTPTRGIRRLDAQTLRSAVVWSEILKPPLGLRDLPTGWQGADERE
ncbi:MAG: hypothetical protein AMXMBFR20_32390 [Planctomycetia bacterium]